MAGPELVPDPSFDFNLHGHVGVRIRGMDRAMATDEARRYGLDEGPGPGEPDVIVDHVDRMAFVGSPRHLGIDEAAFDDEAFFMVRRRGGRAGYARIDVERIGSPGCRIVCERRFGPPPLIRAVIHRAAISRGLVPLHGAAFVHEGIGTLVMGWSRSGKTATLLAAMSRGAEFVAADWVYVDGDGWMHGSDESVRLRQWHLDAFPEYAERIAAIEHLRIRAAGAALAGYRSIVPRMAGRLTGSHAIDRLTSRLERRAYTDVRASRLFGDASRREGARLDRLTVTVATTDPRPRIEPTEPAEIVQRLAAVREEASQDLAAAYRMFRFAHPGRRNALLDADEQPSYEGLARTLERMELRVAYHPYPAAGEVFLAAVTDGSAAGVSARPSSAGVAEPRR